jgi:hypothetical protein
MVVELNNVVRLLKSSGDESKIGILEQWYSKAAILVLAEPGMGKTTLFRSAAENEESALFITASKLLSYPPEALKSKVLYIDALDEMRSGRNGSEVLDQVLGKLAHLEFPSFRLSCREQDWYGNADRSKIESDYKEITELRLLPLSQEQVCSAINGIVADPELYVREAYKRGIESFLENPLTLKMMLELYIQSSGSWPATKKKLYEDCAQLLIRERADSAHTVDAELYSDSDLLNAAGKLSAMYLLSGLEGFSSTQNVATASTPFYLEYVSSSQRPLYKSLAKRRIFVSEGGYFKPLHRTFAEFLAGKYIASQLNSHPSMFNRIKRLIVGCDGKSVSELRGLSAWTGSFNSEYRADIIAADSLTLALNGDTSLFNAFEKTQLLNGLRKLADEFHDASYDHNSRKNNLGTLCDSETIEFIKSELQNASAQSEWSYIRYLLDAISYSPAQFTQLYDVLDQFIMGHKGKGLSYAALNALIKQLRGTDHAKLISILDRINAGIISDSRQELRSLLIRNLYPKYISAIELLKYLECAPMDSYIGSYKMFIDHDFHKTLSDESSRLVIEYIIERMPVFDDENDDEENAWDKTNPLHTILINTFVKLLRSPEAAISSDELYKWFRCFISNGLHHQMDSTQQGAMKEYFSMHPDRYIQLAYRCAVEEPKRFNFNLFRWRANYSPTDQELDQLARKILDSMADANIGVHKRKLFGHAWNLFAEKAQASVQDLEILYNHSQKYADLNDAYFTLNVCADNEPGWDWRRNDAISKTKKIKRKQKNIDALLAINDQLLNGEAYRELLHLSQLYFQNTYDINEKYKWLASIERKYSQEIADIAELAFKAFVKRSDAQSMHSIIDQYCSTRSFQTEAFLFMAGADLLSLDGELDLLPEHTFPALIAWGALLSSKSQSRWYEELITNNASTASDVISYLLESGLKHNTDHIPLIDVFASESNSVFPQLRKSISLYLFEKYYWSSFDNFEALFWAVEKSHAKNEVLDSVGKMLGYHLPTQHRSFLLTYCLCASEADYIHQFIEFHSRSLEWAYLIECNPGDEWLNACAYSIQKHWGSFKSILPSTLVKVWELFSKSMPSTYDSELVVRYRSEREISDVTKRILSLLGTDTSDMSTIALKEMYEQYRSSPWWNYIVYELYNHYQAKRDAHYRHPTFGETWSILDNRDPVNAADLFEIIRTNIQYFADTIRTQNPVPYKLFWNSDSRGKLTNPKIENDCRDAMIAGLRHLFPSTISLEKEGNYAHDNRADIKVIFGGMNVPVEVKRDNHPKLLSSVEQQLIDKYTIDPGCEEFGVYVVLWFAHDDTRRPKELDAPTSLEHLTQQIKARVPANLTEKVEVICIDCRKE